MGLPCLERGRLYKKSDKYTFPAIIIFLCLRHSLLITLSSHPCDTKSGAIRSLSIASLSIDRNSCLTGQSSPGRAITDIQLPLDRSVSRERHPPHQQILADSLCIPGEEINSLSASPRSTTLDSGLRRSTCRLDQHGSSCGVNHATFVRPSLF